MKTKLAISLGVLLLPLLLLAQGTNKRAPGFFVIKSSLSSKEIIAKHMAIDALNIADISIIPTQEAEKRYGKLEENSLVAVVTLNPGVRISTLGEFYKKHDIKGNKRNLPFVIDGQAITDTTNLVIEESSVKVLKIRTDSIEIMTSAHLRFLENRKKIKHH